MRLTSDLTAPALPSAFALAGKPPTMAASHSNAPLVKQDPQPNITDVYAIRRTRVVCPGPGEDGFYADTSAIFDLLDPQIVDNYGDLNDRLAQDGKGVDGFKGYNVIAYAIQIPLDKLKPTRYAAPVADQGNVNNPLPLVAQATRVGVYAWISRGWVTLRSPFCGF